jgi:hypothetical protein
MKKTNRNVPAPQAFLDNWQVVLWIAFAGLLIYGKSLSFGYTYLDDSIFILDRSQYLAKLYFSRNQDQLASPHVRWLVETGSKNLPPEWRKHLDVK